LKKLFHHPMFVRALAATISFYMYLVFATSRVHVVTPLPASLVSGPVLLASWHQQILMLPVMGRPSPSKMLALIAASRAGVVIRTVATWFNIGAVEGSSRRGGMEGARLLIRAARTGHTLYITPDGSRGPVCIAKDGATEIARLTCLPLIPCAAWPMRGRTLDTWDSFRFPYPFGSIRVAYDEPLQELNSKGLSDALNRLTAQVRATPPGPESKR